MSIDLTELRAVHFIGIGGIGISAIARMFHLEGKQVTGSDRGESKVTLELEQAGIKVFLDQKAENVPARVDLVVYTLAIPPDNPEFVRAKELGVALLSYPEALGLVSAQKYTVGVTGTHGKTTTTAMLGKILIEAGLDPTAVVGSLVPEWNSNFRSGKSKYFVTEACEYRRSFLNLNPQAAIITNIDNDHLDYYKDLSDIESAFAEFAAKIPADGFLVCDPADERLASVLASAKCRIVDYMEYVSQSAPIALKQPGEHNQKDAAAALALAVELGVEEKTALNSLANFAGTWRRFEFKGKLPNGVMVYDDYAHHPTEIKATLQGARELVGKDHKITVVFQPHLYSRTKLLLHEFADAFAAADLVLMPDIYAAREINDGTISSRDVIGLIQAKGKDALYVPSFDELTKKLRDETAAGKPGDMVISMGAGEAFKTGEAILKAM
jgi:UDP-N-acetylmuramate--alanine ligase